MTSFFEKLTGVSTEDEETTNTPKKGSTHLVADLKQESKQGPKKTIKKQNISMPKLKKEPEEITLVEPKTEELDEKKDWLEEADDEEGQLTIDVYQTDANIVIKSTVAGVNPENIDIDINNDMVTVKGKRTKDEMIKTENYFYQELYWGTFSRSVILPVEVDSDKARATIKNGILTIKLPKLEKTKSKKIKVKLEV